MSVPCFSIAKSASATALRKFLSESHKDISTENRADLELFSDNYSSGQSIQALSHDLPSTFFN